MSLTGLVTGVLVALGLVILAAPPLRVDAPADGGWRYVVPPPGGPFDHPPLRALALSDTRPEDVEEAVTYRGARRRYAQLRYGATNSVRVTVVVDEVGPRDVDLYVDAGRQRRITAKDKVPGQDLTWRLSLGAAMPPGEAPAELPRTVVFRYGPSGRTLSFATAGYLEGHVALGGRRLAARRADATGNGLFGDPLDRLWLDLDDDGRWDPAAEQFLVAPVLTVGGDRFALRTDARGERLTLDRLEGAGTVRLELPRLAKERKVVALAATLVGRDGSAVTLSGAGAEAALPAGEYRLGSVTVAVDDPAGGPAWTFTFADNGARPPERWYAVASGKVVTIDPVGELDFRTGLDDPAAAKPGADLSFQAKLYTGDGLLIVAALRGTPAAPSSRGDVYAEFALEGDGGKALSSARSGFA
jgi:hypothetical protein